MTKTCANSWCEGVHRAKGWCARCYIRLQKGQDPTIPPRKKVPSTATVEERLEFHGWDVVQRDTPYAEGPCWEWKGRRDRKGYGVFATSEKKQTFTHREAYRVWKNPNNVLNVLHTCDNPPCINPDHLWEGTTEDNLRDMTIKERGNTRKLTGGIVKELRSRPVFRGCCTQWGLEFGVAPSTIRGVLKERTWRHLL